MPFIRLRRLARLADSAWLRGDLHTYWMLSDEIAETKDMSE